MGPFLKAAEPEAARGAAQGRELSPKIEEQRVEGQTSEHKVDSASGGGELGGCSMDRS